MDKLEPIILDTNFNIIGIVDDYESMIWTERYLDTGDFELYGPIGCSISAYCKLGYYVIIPGSRRGMIIENIEQTQDTESSKILVSGRSLESILYNRIVWDQTIVTGNVQDCIYTLLYDSILNPSNSKRAIPNFIFERSTDPLVTDCYIESAQFTGDTIYEAIYQFCEAFDIAFKIEFDESFNMIFSLYAGQNRTFNQTNNPFVIYSPDFDNVVSSEMKNSITNYANLALVAGEGEGSDRVKTSYTNESEEPSGLSRKELFVDARDISSNTDEGTLTQEEYLEQLQQRGQAKLEEVEEDWSIDAQIDTLNSYIYGKDYFIGDVLQIVGFFDYLTAQIRITEFIKSYDANGYSAYPQFKILALGDYTDGLYHYLRTEGQDIITDESGESIEIDI